MQFVCGLLYSVLFGCYLFYVFCILITRFIFLILFNFVFLFCLFWFLLCVFLCFCIVFCIVSPHVYSCLFSICVQVYWPLPQGGNPTAVNKYRIISYIISRIVSKDILT
jgi:hypothetical protein